MRGDIFSTHKNYSSNSISHGNSKPIEILDIMKWFNSGPTIRLDPTNYDQWTKEEVCSFLLTEKRRGGAGLTDAKVHPLYEAGFDGTSLANIVLDLLTEKKAVVEAWETYPNINRNTLKTVVIWVDNLLKTKKLFHLLTPDQLKELVCGSILSEKEFQPFKNMSGSEFHLHVVDYIKAKYSQIQLQNKSIDIPPKLSLWVENNHFNVIPRYNLLDSWKAENNIALHELVSRLV